LLFGVVVDRAGQKFVKPEKVDESGGKMASAKYGDLPTSRGRGF
jgi:hypothetical protein